MHSLPFVYIDIAFRKYHSAKLALLQGSFVTHVSGSIPYATIKHLKSFIFVLPLGGDVLIENRKLFPQNDYKNSGNVFGFAKFYWHSAWRRQQFFASITPYLDMP